jgi:hypothetical protein
MTLFVIKLKFQQMYYTYKHIIYPLKLVQIFLFNEYAQHLLKVEKNEHSCQLIEM